jgi:hypothetical protein
LLKANGWGGEWGTREVRRAVRREIKDIGEDSGAVSVWSKKFTEQLSENRAIAELILH